MEEDARWVDLEPGSTFAGYQIGRRLGRGGMGIVYEATEAGLERRVALKLIAPEVAADEVFRRRFADESRIAASVEHPNVVPIYAAGEEGGVPWIAMRYVSGSDLGRRIAKGGRLSPEDAVRIIAQVAGGLDALHAVGLIHRDVKPANVLLSGAEGAEHAYLTDFGVARNVATTSGLTKTGRFVGTVDYVAPEQIRGGEIDARADVYALGCMLYKALTGEPPFRRDDDVAMLYAHLNEEPPAPSRTLPLVPPALDGVVARAMAKDPGQRFPSAGDLGRGAQGALRGGDVTVPERTVATGAAAGELTQPIAAGHVSGEATARMPPTLQPPQRRRRLGTGAWAVGAGVAALALIVAFAFLGGSDEEPSRPASADRATTNTVASGGGEPASAATLSQQELIRRADSICKDSQNEFLAARAAFPLGETDTTQAVPFARRLGDISARQVARLEALRPPVEIEGLYETYLDLRRDVHDFDRRALAAAAGGDLGGFQSWRRANTEAGPERSAIAQEIGFEVCSANPNPRG